MALVTPYWGLDGILFLTVAIAIAYLYMTRNFKYWKKRGIVEFEPIPFFGNFMECLLLKKSAGYVIKELYDKTKELPYVGFYIFDRPAILIRDRKLVKNVLVKDFHNFTNRYISANVNDRLSYSNLFLVKSPNWKILRTNLTSFFTSVKLKNMFHLMLDCCENLDSYLASLKLEGKGKIVDVKDVAAKFTTDIIATTAYGLNVNSLKNPDAEFRKCGKRLFQYNLLRSYELLAVFFMPKLVSLIRLGFFDKSSRIFLRKVFWETINNRIKSGEKRNDLIDMLIELRKTYGDRDIGGFKFDGDDLVAQAAIFFTGGFETSSATIAFTLHELALHLDIQNKLRKDILDALKKTNGQLTYDSLSLPYLDMVLSESLRLYPILPFLDRITAETYQMPDSDLVLEKSTPVYISMLGMQHDPEYFPNPDIFDPERFNEENKRNIPSCVYFPFGEGPRNCVGARMGLIQSKLGIIQFLRKYEITPCEKTLIPMVLDPKATTTAPLGGGIYLNVRKINVDAD